VAARKRGRPEHEPTEVLMGQVEALVAVGTPHEQIAIVLEISTKTLRKHYQRQLDTGKVLANAKVAQTLFKQATKEKNPSIPAAIFWMKTQAGWSEKNLIEHSGTIGGAASDEERVDRVVAILDAARERRARKPSS
jgi:hypothetical protein